MKRTAVQWLIDQLGIENMDATISQALEMEREQMERIADMYALHLLCGGNYQTNGIRIMSPKEFTENYLNK